MSEEKCFCHFNGYAVKDATARADIENIKNKLVGKGVIYDLADSTFNIESNVNPHVGHFIEYYDTSNRFTELNVGDYLVLKVTSGKTYFPLVKVEYISEKLYTFKVIGDLTAESSTGGGDTKLYWHNIKWSGGADSLYIQFTSTDNTPFTVDTFQTYLINKLNRRINANGQVGGVSVTALAYEVYNIWSIKCIDGTSSQPTEAMAFSDTVTEA